MTNCNLSWQKSHRNVHLDVFNSFEQSDLATDRRKSGRAERLNATSGA